MKSWLQRIGRYMGYTALWCLVAVVVVWAVMSSRSHRKEQLVTSLNVTVEGRAEQPLVDAQLINDWIVSHSQSPVGRTIADVDLAELERVTLQHSAVASANAYATYSGSVEVSVEQHTPMARLKVDGYDMYLTSDGYLFPASDGYAVLVPVITGSYRPIFGPRFSGYASTVVRDSIAALDSVIVALEQQKIPHYEERQEYRQEVRSVLNKRVQRTLFMSEYEYSKRTDDLNEQKALKRKESVERYRTIDNSIASLGAQQEAVREQQMALRRLDEDFSRLVQFVGSIRRSEFWSAEVVQMIIDGGGYKAMEVAFVPRSGRFLVDMGHTDRMDAKLGDLRRFYDDGLDNIGWSKYRHISLRYEGQVVCK